MGMVYKISCKCGYNKELYLGGGLSSCSLNLIDNTFSEEKLKKFKEDFKAEKVKRFTTENVAAFCEKCQEIIQTANLKVELTDGYKYNILNECPICKGKVTTLDENYKCPICDSDMDVKSVGIWD